MLLYAVIGPRLSGHGYDDDPQVEIIFSTAKVAADYISHQFSPEKYHVREYSLYKTLQDKDLKAFSPYGNCFYSVDLHNFDKE